MLIIITIILIIVSSCLSLIPVLRKFFKNRTEFVTFILTLIATFIGVFWAIELNNKNIDEIETENAIKLLNATKLEINNKITSHELCYEIINGNIPHETPKSFINRNPVELSNLFQITISNELILRKLSTNGIQELHNCSDNLFSMQKAINTDTTLIDSTITILLKSFIKQQKFSILILNLEMDYLEGLIERKNIDAEYDSLFIDYFKDENIYNLDSVLEQKRGTAY